jgi:hypothetical protein
MAYYASKSDVVSLRTTRYSTEGGICNYFPTPIRLTTQGPMSRSRNAWMDKFWPAIRGNFLPHRMHHLLQLHSELKQTISGIIPLCGKSHPYPE